LYGLDQQRFAADLDRGLIGSEATAFPAGQDKPENRRISIGRRVFRVGDCAAP
jgi:hypothetical protein